MLSDVTSDYMFMESESSFSAIITILYCIKVLVSAHDQEYMKDTCLFREWWNKAIVGIRAQEKLKVFASWMAYNEYYIDRCINDVNALNDNSEK